jgi:hypothetical protein
MKEVFLMSTKSKDGLPGNGEPAPRNSNTLSVEEFRARIKKCHTVTDSWAMGLICADVYMQLNDEDQKDLRKDLPLTPNELKMYTGIGRSGWLYESKYKDQLPAGYSVLYQLSLLHGDEIDKALADGIIKPDVKRNDIIKFKKKIRGEPEPETLTKAERLAKSLSKLSAEEKLAFAALSATPVVASPGIAPADQDAPATAR